MLIYPYPHPLVEGQFLKRYKRFFADILLPDGRVETVHCANSGSMKSCLIENAPAYILDSFNTERKLRFSLELLKLPDGLACLNTARANTFVEKILQSTIGQTEQDYFVRSNFPYHEFLPYQIYKREAKFNDLTRFDFCLSSPSLQKKCWIEVKSVSLRLDENTIAFPDAVTLRGQKHLLDLMQAKKDGDDAWIFFAIMRGSEITGDLLAQTFRACHEIDKTYALLLENALKCGVKMAIVVPSLSVDGFGLRFIKAF